MSKSYIVIPTYNESGNIEKLIAKIFALGINDLHILVVDDSSPDGTGELVLGLQNRYSDLELLSRQTKDGLGRAYLAGFAHALKAGADYIFEMDADFSHDPKYLPDFFDGYSASGFGFGFTLRQGWRRNQLECCPAID